MLLEKRDCREKQQGFSLIELLVAIAIVAILVSVAVPVFANQRAKADTAVAQAEGNAIAKTLRTVLSGRAGTNFSNGLGPQISISMRDGAGVIHYGRGATLVREPFEASLSEGSVLTGGLVAGSSQQENFCIRVQHNSGQSAVYNQDGLQPAGSGCYDGAVDTTHPHPPTLSYDSNTDTITITPPADTDGKPLLQQHTVHYNTDSRIISSLAWGIYAAPWPTDHPLNLVTYQTAAACTTVSSTLLKANGTPGTCARPAGIGEHLPGGGQPHMLW